MEIREINEELSKYIKEDLADAIVDASANIGQQEMVDILFGVIARYVPQDTLERIKASFEFELVKDKNESVNEAQIEKAPFNEGKIVKSDMLNFGIGINPTKDGFVLGTISYGSQIQPFRKEGATQEEVIDVVDRVASIVENHIDDIEYAISRIGENFGFRK